MVQRAGYLLQVVFEARIGHQVSASGYVCTFETHQETTGIDMATDLGKRKM
jgi:hypothetical protein